MPRRVHVSSARALAPDLLAFQRDSFERFLQLNAGAEKRRETGLQAAFLSTFPIKTPDENAELTFESYAPERPRYSWLECMKRGMTYAAPLKVTVRLITWDVNGVSKMIRDVKEQEVYFGEVPLMTERGTFVFDGREVVLNGKIGYLPGLEIHSSADGNEAHLHDLYGNELVLTHQTDGSLRVRLELDEAVPPQALLQVAASTHTLEISDQGLKLTLSGLPARPLTSQLDAHDAEGRLVLKGGKRLTETSFKKLSAHGPPTIFISERDAAQLRPAAPVLSPDGQPWLSESDRLTRGTLQTLKSNGITKLEVKFGDEKAVPLEEVRFPKFDVGELMRWFDQHIDVFELGHAGRVRLSAVIGREGFDSWLTASDVCEVAEQLCSGKLKSSSLISNLSPNMTFDAYTQASANAEAAEMKRRVWAAGEVLTQAAWVGLRLVCAEVRNRMARSSDEVDTLMPHDLINAKQLARSFRFLLESKSRTALADDLQPLALLEQLRTLSADRHRLRPTGFPKQLPVELQLDEYGFFAELDAPWPTTATEALVPFGIVNSHEQTQHAAEHLQSCSPSAEPEVPRVGTGVEAAVAHATGDVLVAREAGEIVGVLEGAIAVRPSKNDAMPWLQLLRGVPYSNRGTLSRVHTLVSKGQRVQAGELLATGPGTNDRELALGHNLLVTFDERSTGSGITLSERVVQSGRFTSKHVRLLECGAIDTRFGKEEITLDLPGGQPLPAHLDDSGIVKLGTKIEPGMVLVGKITPLESGAHFTPEEKLLRAIFGERNGEVQNTSLIAGPEDRGVVTHVQIMARRGVERSDRHKTIVEELVRSWNELAAAAPELEPVCSDEVRWLERGDDLAPGVIVIVRVVIESTRPVAIGDRLADRHGFVGTVERIVPEAEMPQLPDGRPFEALLPWVGLGPSAGALAEMRLGMAALAQDAWLEVPHRTKPDDDAVRSFCERANVFLGRPAGLAYLVKLLAN
jgi:DNA-directed RNA polymerase subunit beta